MKHPKLNILLALLLIISTSGAVYFGIKSNLLHKQLFAKAAQQSQLENRIALEEELMGIDSLLIDGKYKKALTAYKDQYDNAIISDDPGIEMRLALVKEFLRLQYETELAAYRQESLAEVDSIQVEPIPTALEIQIVDSLNFALEKAKVQLASMKRQLNSKSFGEYLRFTNRKGSQMHYVGQVKNDKANGFGVALLNTGSRYEGEWKDNQRHGKGTYYWSDGEYYVGEYLNDKRNGEGTYYWPNGEKYTGHWKDDKRSGEGIFYGKDGEIIADGIWQDDKLALLDKDEKKQKTGS